MVTTPRRRSDRSRDVLVRTFRAFYREVAASRRSWERLDAESGGDSGKEPVAPEDRGPARSPAAQVSRRLAGLLDEYAVLGRRLPPQIERDFEEARYLLAAIADDLFLFHGPDGEAWKEHLLERASFGTAVAGDVVIERIERLLANPEHASTDLATAYLLALSLGFEGRLRRTSTEAAAGRAGSDTGFGGRTKLEHLKRELFQLLYRRGPRIAERRDTLFPAAYEGIAKGGREPLVSRQGRWALALAVSIVLYLVVTSAAWSRDTRHVRVNVDEIIESLEVRASGQ